MSKQTLAQTMQAHDLVNAAGDRVCLLNYGARIMSIELRLHAGRRQVVLGYPSPQDYLEDTAFLGSTVGRFGNRIAAARFALNGQTFRLDANEGQHQLHGGSMGFDRRFWKIDPTADRRRLTFRLESADGDQGFPGRLTVSVSYQWSDQRELSIHYLASTDQPTHVNLTNHAYFNLDGGRGDVLDHQLEINGSQVVTVDREMIPTGELRPVDGCDLDLRSARRVGDLLTSGDTLIRSAGGLDLHYVLDNGDPAAVLSSSNEGLQLTVRTSYPGLQCYSGQHLGAPWSACAGLCLEAQYFPDSPNQAHFPSTVLQPGQQYQHWIKYRFGERA